MSNYYQVHKEIYKPFIVTVDTTIAGSSGVGKFTLPYELNYRSVVDWGDGTIETIVNGDSLTHDYVATAGTGSSPYTLKVSGKIDHWRFNNLGDKLKLKTVESWGNMVWKFMGQMFRGCSNMTCPATDTPVMEYVVDCTQMFQNCSLFNANLGSWDVSKVQNMNRMFFGCTNFNNGGSASINNWDVSSCTNMANMFDSTPFNQPLSSWNMTGVTSILGMFQSATAFNQDLSAWDTSSVTLMYRCFDSASSFNNGEVGNTGANPLTWTNTAMTQAYEMFDFATSFNQDLGANFVTSNTFYMPTFYGASLFNNGGSNSIDSWDISGTTSLAGVFRDATTFNQPLPSWNVSSITSFLSLFNGATSFIQDITGWNVGSATNMGSMFANTTAFNQDISGWNMSGVTSIVSMFQSATAFNQNLSAWDTSSVTLMYNCFNSASSFNNGEVGNTGANPLTWTTTAMTQAYGMFDLATSFNQDLGANFVTSNTFYMPTFYGASLFNNGGSNSIDSWDITGTTSLAGVFRDATAFNQPLPSWDVSSITSFLSLFNGAIAFNQTLSSWNVGSATNISYMFQNATAFNQNVGGWDVTSCTDFTNFMNGKTAANYSAANLDAIYGNGTTTGWAFNGGAAGVLSASESISFGTINYTTATSQAGRDVLTNAPNNWIITDGGGI